MKVAIWLGERALELLLGALLVLAIYDPSDFPRGATPWQELKVNLFAVSFFYVASGYIVSCVALGLLKSRSAPVRHGATMTLVFVGHCLVFFLIGAAGFPFLAVAVGALIVLFINFVGSAFLEQAAGREAPPAD